MAKAKPITDIEPDGSALDSIALVLRTRLKEMCDLREQALNFDDPAGVHDMRVASRRFRSALKDFTPYLDTRRVRSSAREIKLIARALGRVRDHDVAILALHELADEAPVEVAPGIRCFAAYRKAPLEEARIKLAPVLSSENLAQLQVRLEQALHSGRPATKNVETTYRQVASATIADRLTAFEDLSSSLYRPLKVKPLHKLRLAAKNLRYAMDLFEPIWMQTDGSSFKAFSKKVAAMQGSLGKVHDCDVWIDEFGEEARDRTKVVVDFDHFATTLWLLRHFVEVRGKHISAALRQWQEWEKEGWSAKIRRGTGVPPVVPMWHGHLALR
ncbi:MAG TPA: CHAD domain-containing protein [Pyrinomonadaceae bacterium]|nr:CHAD domain-containing protein [Pyrinomonadaceae bacterium]